MQVMINGQLRVITEGWVMVNGQLRQITEGWAMIDALLKTIWHAGYTILVGSWELTTSNYRNPYLYFFDNKLNLLLKIGLNRSEIGGRIVATQYAPDGNLAILAQNANQAHNYRASIVEPEQFTTLEVFSRYMGSVDGDFYELKVLKDGTFIIGGSQSEQAYIRRFPRPLADNPIWELRTDTSTGARVQEVALAEDDTIWAISNTNFLHKIYPSGDYQLIRFDNSNIYNKSVTVDAEGNIWVASSSHGNEQYWQYRGFYKYAPDGTKIFHKQTLLGNIGPFCVLANKTHVFCFYVETSGGAYQYKTFVQKYTLAGDLVFEKEVPEPPRGIHSLHLNVWVAGKDGAFYATYAHEGEYNPIYKFDSNFELVAENAITRTSYPIFHFTADHGYIGHTPEKW